MTKDLSNKAVALKLVAGTLIMFGFGFALVPLYDVFCRVTGINGKVDLTKGEFMTSPATSRQVKIQFIAVNNEAMPWQFGPKEASLKVTLGQTYQTAYLAKNQTQRYMVAQAVPSVAPAEAAAYLQKVNCFCFNRQPLKAGEFREMGLAFTLLPEMPTHIKTLTLSYTLFDITETDQGSLALKD